MITVRPAVKRDLSEIIIMVHNFRSSYDGCLTQNIKSMKQMVIDYLPLTRIIESDGKIAGYFTIMNYWNKVRAWNGILDMYVKAEFRGQGVARDARMQAVKKDKILTISISYKRARENADYFVAQGFDHVAFDPAEQGAKDHNLCVLVRGENNDYPRCVPLNFFNINTLQADADKYWTNFKG